DPAKGYYSYDLGAWHILAVNGEIDVSASSPQVQWLRADLAANTKLCTLAYWHGPRFVTGSVITSNPTYQTLWDTLYKYGAEVVVNGVNHPPTAVPGGPYTGTEGTAVSFDGSGSSDPDGDALTYAWSFGDGATGSGVRPTHAYADNGTYTVTLTVTDARGSGSGPATTTATIGNVAPTVNAGPNQTVTLGSPITVSATF